MIKKYLIFMIIMLSGNNVLFGQNVLRDSVQVSSDDTWEKADGTVDPTKLTVLLGYDNNNRWGGTRFININIPKGAIIDSAAVAHAFNYGGNPVDVTIFGEASDNPATYSNTANNVSSRPRTNSSVLWQATSITQQFIWSPNIKAIIQEIIDRPGYVQGNPINIIYQINVGHQPNPGGLSYDASPPASAPKLYVSWTVPSAPTKRYRMVQ